MKGSAISPISAVKTRNTATLLVLKYFSTRYLSRCVESAHSTGPEKAKNNQDIAPLTNERERHYPASRTKRKEAALLTRPFSITDRDDGSRHSPCRSRSPARRNGSATCSSRPRRRRRRPAPGS